MDCAGITDHLQQLARLAATKPLTLETTESRACPKVSSHP